MILCKRCLSISTRTSHQCNTKKHTKHIKNTKNTTHSSMHMTDSTEMLHSWNPQNPGTKIPRCKFELNQNLNLNLYREVPKNLRFTIRWISGMSHCQCHTQNTHQCTRTYTHAHTQEPPRSRCHTLKHSCIKHSYIKPLTNNTHAYTHAGTPTMLLLYTQASVYESLLQSTHMHTYK